MGSKSQISVQEGLRNFSGKTTKYKQELQFQKINYNEFVEEKYQNIWPILYFRKRFYEAPIKNFLKSAAFLERLPRKYHEEYPWKYGEIQIHKRHFLQQRINLIKCKYLKGFRCSKFHRSSLRTKCNFKWNAVQRELAKVKIPLNSLKLKNTWNRHIKFIDIPLISPDIWDYSVYRTERILKMCNQEACHVDSTGIKPIAAIQNSYEDPYSNAHAEMKAIGIKGVNFVIISRSYFSSKQLAKKVALEMNCTLLDPMLMMETYFHNEATGFYIPSKIKEKFEDYFIKAEIERTKFDEKYYSLMFKYISSQEFKQFLKSEEVVVSNEEKSRESSSTTGEQSNKSLPTIKSSIKEKEWFVKLLLRKEKTEDDILAMDSTPRKREVSKVRSNGSSKDSEAYTKKFSDSASKELSPNYDYKSEPGETSEQTSYRSVRSLKITELEEVLNLEKHKLLNSNSSFKKAFKKLCKAVLKKNIQLPEDVCTKAFNEEVNSNASYTKGYVLVGFPIFFNNSKPYIQYWKTVFQCSNPPDVIVYSQCPEEEVQILFEELRVNPFLHNELYYSSLLNQMLKISDAHVNNVLLEFQEIINKIYSGYKDRDIPISEAMTIDYCEALLRASIFNTISGKEDRSHRKRLRFGLGQEHDLFNEDWEDDDSITKPVCPSRFTGAAIPLESYVRIPKNIVGLNNKINATYNFEAVFMNMFIKNYPDICVLRTDVRTPISYQFSIIKRWFDYSGLSSKARPITGEICKESLFCELIGRIHEKENLQAKFMDELSAKIKPTSDIYNENEEENSIVILPEMASKLMNFEEEEEATQVLKSSTVGSSSEFGVTERYPLPDEFHFLKDDFEESMSVTVDEKQLSLSEDHNFYRTHQCYFSTWIDRCPVAHYYYKCRRGSLINGVRLHDKVYLLSSDEAKKDFIRNPSKYLIPMLPEAQCQVLILGRPKSGKTYIAEAIATFFDAYVINFKSLEDFAKEQQKRKYIQSMNENLTSLINEVFLEDISQDYVDQIASCTEWIEKAYQLVAFQARVFKPIMWDIYNTEVDDDPENALFTIPEFYSNNSDIGYIRGLLEKNNLSPISIDVLLKACENLPNSTTEEPYFLKNRLNIEVYLDTFLDILLRNHFSIFSIRDIYGSFDLCKMYTLNPVRLLERLPKSLLPIEKAHGNVMNESLTDIRDKFFMNSIALPVKEKIDALGTVIISIEDQKRKEGVLRYGGWVIDGMPNNTKLLTGLDNAGLFPRNIIFLDNPDEVYGTEVTHHELMESRMSDIEKNLACYVTQNFRHEILPLRKDNIFNKDEHGLILKGQSMPDYNTEFLYHSERLARLKVLNNVCLEELRTDDRESINYWPGQFRMKSEIYDSFPGGDLYSKLPESELDIPKFYDLMDVVFLISERKNIKPIESLGLLQSTIVEKYQNFLYSSKNFANILKPKKRIFKLLNCFYVVLKEDSLAPANLEFVPFTFFDKKMLNNFREYPDVDKQKGYSYLYHLAYALELNMIYDKNPDNENLMKDIYSKVARMGYSAGIYNTPKESNNVRAIDNRITKTHNPPPPEVLKCSDYSFLHLNLLSPYFLEKMFETGSKIISPKISPNPEDDRKLLKSEEAAQDIMEHIYTSENLKLIEEINQLSLQKPSQKKLKKILTLAIDAIKRLFELHTSTFIQKKYDKHKNILYFPRSVMFLREEQKMYDLCLINNRVCSETQEICDKVGNYNNFIILLNDDFWNDWHFKRIEDYNGYLKYNFWDFSSELIREDELEIITKCIKREKALQTTTFCLIATICSIQDEINALKLLNKSFLSYGEEALLNYFIWLRNRFIKKHLNYFKMFGFQDYEKLMRHNSQFFPAYIPSFFDIYLKLTGDYKCKRPSFKQNLKLEQSSISVNEKNNKGTKNFNKDSGCDLNYNNLKSRPNQDSKSNEPRPSFYKHAYVNEPWPFRSVWRSRPKFIGLYDSYLWEEISKMSSRSYEFESENLITPEKTVEKPREEEIYVDVIKESNKFEELKWKLIDDVPMLLNESTVMKFDHSERSSKESNYYKDFERRNPTLDKRFGDTVYFLNPWKLGVYRKSLYISNIKEVNSGVSEKSVVQKDGTKRPPKENEVFRDVVELNAAVKSSPNPTRMTWISLDEYGPFKVLYSILDLIKGSRHSPIITKNNLADVIDHFSNRDGVGEEQYLYEEESTVSGPVKIDKTTLCIVSLFDGYVKNGNTAFSANIRGQEYYFCSHECMVRFRWSPEKFVNIIKPFENVYPFNIFYSEVPCGYGKLMSSLLSYVFGLQLFYMDDYLIQRLTPIDNSLDDLKSLALMSDLRFDNLINWENISISNNELLKDYLVSKASVPWLKNIIHDVWKKNNFCLYNFPHNTMDFSKALNESVIPEVILISTLQTMSVVSEFQAYDIIDNYIGQMISDKLLAYENKYHQLMYWANVWKSRFTRALKYLKEEDKAGLVSKLQCSLINYFKKLQMSNIHLRPFDALKTHSIWSDDSMSINTPRALENLGSDILDPGSLTKNSEYLKDDLKPISCNFSDCPIMNTNTSASLEKINFKKGQVKKYLEDKRLSLEPLYQNILQTNPKIDEANSQNFIDAFKMLRFYLEAQLSNALKIMNDGKTDDTENVIKRDEEDLRMEVLSFDSIAFDDYDALPTFDISDWNSLRLLALALKHTNYLNPVPVNTFNTTYFNIEAESIKNLLQVFIDAFGKSTEEHKETVTGVNFVEVDINDKLMDVVEQVRKSRKPSQNAECVIDLERADVENILKSGYYFLSSFGRQCPVEVQKKCTYPQKKILYDSSNCFPVAHRRYVYFLESEEALEAFKNNPLDYVNKSEYNPIIPIKIVLFGPNTQRTNRIIKSLVKEYSLCHITVSEAIEYFIKQASWTRTGQKLKWLISYVNCMSYPNALPISLIWQAIEFMMATPKSATHGYIITGLKPELDLFRQWEQTKFKPHIIFYFTVADQRLFYCYQIHNIKKMLINYTRQKANFEIMIKHYLEASPAFMKSESFLWTRSSHLAYIQFLETYYYNVHTFMYENSAFVTFHKMSMCILDVFKQLKVLYSTMYKEIEVFVPVGKLISKYEYMSAASKSWNSNCPICISSKLRVNKTNNLVLNRNNIYLFKNIPAWICKNHRFSSLVWTNPEVTSLDVELNFEVSPGDTLSSKLEKVQLKGLCPVCYWLYKPHEELRYRCGHKKYLCNYANKQFKLCSPDCFKEFSSRPILYSFFNKFLDVRLKYGITPLKNYPFDISYWDSTAMKEQVDVSIMGNCTKCLLFYRLMRLAVLLNVRYPGWTTREARLFFIYVMTQSYLSTSKAASRWRMILIDFLRLSGTSRRILNQFFATRGKEMPELIELLVARM